MEESTGPPVVAEFAAQPDRTTSRDGVLTRDQVVADEVDLDAGTRGLSEMVAGGGTLDDALTEVAAFAAQAIPGVDGVGVTLIRPQGATMGVATWAVTAPFVREIDILQYETLQEGPCITCMQDRVAQTSGSLGDDRRWPRFGAQVSRLGVSSALALPLGIGDQVVGSINCYAYAQDAFGEHAVRLGSLFAGPAAVAVHNAQVLAGVCENAAQLQRALSSRTAVDQAVGIIRTRSGGTAEEALARLRRISQDENITLDDVARRMVEVTVNRARARLPSPDGTP